jgi:BlaI family transcriptional regulator, penicillinase repressor
MAKHERTPRLSGAEMSIVRMLWERKCATLSEAHQAMRDRGEQIGYTTVQTRLERLVRKGVVVKDPRRPAKYRAAVAPEDVSAPLLDLLVQRVSSPVPLMAHLLQDPSLTKEDFCQVKRLIAKAEQVNRQRPPEES